jgi:hypothetical protein
MVGSLKVKGVDLSPICRYQDEVQFRFVENGRLLQEGDDDKVEILCMFHVAREVHPWDT